MKPGEYIGADGTTYRWTRDGDNYWHHSGEWRDGWVIHSSVAAEDWPKAKAALDELIEEEAGEWVEITACWRIRPDGSQPQYLAGSGMWQPFTEYGIGCWADAYRKGRELALEQVRELVEAVENAYLAGGCLSGVLPVITRGQWDRIRDAAKKVEL